MFCHGSISALISFHVPQRLDLYLDWYVGQLGCFSSFCCLGKLRFPFLAGTIITKDDYHG